MTPGDRQSESEERPSSASTPDKLNRSPLLSKIEQLRQTQKQMKQERKNNAKELRNVTRKTQRLKSKASQLSNAELLEVMQLRDESKRKPRA